MDIIGFYWGMVSRISHIAVMGIAGYWFYRLVKPFLLNKRAAKWIGITYFAVKLGLYIVPWEINRLLVYATGVLAAFLVMYMADKRNVEQKIFLSVTFLALRWLAVAVASSIYEGFNWFFLGRYPAMKVELQFVIYTVLRVVYIVLSFSFLAISFQLLLKAYVYKKSNMTQKELLMLIMPSLSALAGYEVLRHYRLLYEDATGEYLYGIYGVYGVYDVHSLLYYSISFISILVMIIAFQNIKAGQEEERQKERLLEQIENMKSHINEVEKLYQNIRSIKHDMGNHIMVLENLYEKKDHGEAEKYIQQLKQQFRESDLEIKSGNPITDIILREKQKEAKEKGIVFVCKFHYPMETNINAFDVSIILNNALSNAIEGTKDSKKPYIEILSYRKKHAYMIEIKNSIVKPVPMNEEMGLPETSKKDRDNHGFGLINIRKVAQKYYGDIDIWQDGDNFLLSIMMVVD